MERNYKLFIQDIIKSIELIQRYMANVSEDDFYNDPKLQDAVIRRLEVIGEAVIRIPRAVKQKNPSIGWDKIVDYRNFIVHSYFDASLKRIWQVAKLELEDLKNKIHNMILL